MDKVAHYKNVIKKIIAEITAIPTHYVVPTPTQVIIDDERGHYLLYKNTWEGERWRYGCFFHVDVTNTGKIYVNHDGTGLVVVEKLFDQYEVPKTDIVLAFHPPIMRPDTEFAVS